MASGCANDSKVCEENRVRLVFRIVLQGQFRKYFFFGVLGFQIILPEIRYIYDNSKIFEIILVKKEVATLCK